MKVNFSTLQKLPKVYLFNHQLKGRIAVASDHAPRFLWEWDTNDDCRFVLVPISSLEDPSVVEPATKIETRSEFMRKMKEEYKYVAILSCRKGYLSSKNLKFDMARLIHRHPTYASEITKYEIFKLDYHRETNAFSFCSWEGEYLANQWLKGMDVFLKWRSEPSDGTIAEKRSWEVRCVLNTPPGYERIEFMGVANREDYKFYRSAEGSGLFDEQINSFREYLFSQDQLQVGRSMIRIDNHRNQHFYLRLEENLGFIVVVTLGFSGVVAAECLHDLISTYYRYSDEKLENVQNIINDLEKIMYTCDCVQEFTPEGPAQDAKEAINNFVNSSRDVTETEVDFLGQKSDRFLKETLKLRANLGKNIAEFAKYAGWGRGMLQWLGRKAVSEAVLIVVSDMASPVIGNLATVEVGGALGEVCFEGVMEGMLDAVAPGAGLVTGQVVVPVITYASRALGNGIYAIEPSNEFWRRISHIQEDEEGEEGESGHYVQRALQQDLCYRALVEFSRHISQIGKDEEGESRRHVRALQMDLCCLRYKLRDGVIENAKITNNVL